MLRPVLFLILLLTPLAASATPPRYASVVDLPIGISKTHLYLLRSVEDNEGSYFIRKTTRLLVKQNLETGGADQFWLVDVTRETFDDGASPGTVEYADSRGAGDAFALLRAEGAVPLSIGPIFDWSDDAEARLTIDDSYIIDETGLVDTGEGGPAPLIPHDALVAQIRANLGPVLRSIPVDPGPVNPLDLGAEDPLRAPADCAVLGQAANSSPYQLFLLTCENGDYTLSSYRIYLTARPR